MDVIQNLNYEWGEKMARYTLGKSYNLGSSSQGNAFVLELYREDYPNPFRLMIECGYDLNSLSQRLVERGLSMSDINAVLITHEHLDHAQSVSQLIKMGKKIYAPQSVFERFNLMDKVSSRNIMEHGKSKMIADGISVFGMELDHESDDGSKTYNLGYVITIDKKYRILFITDTMHIRWNLYDYQFNAIFIEANNLHRVINSALKTAIENNKVFEVRHYQRVLKSHMLVEKTAKTLATFDLSKTDIIYLIHLSSFTQVNPYEFRTIISDKLKETKQFRIEQYTDKTSRQLKTARKPKIVVAKRNGDWT